VALGELRCWKFHPEIAQRDAKAGQMMWGNIEESEVQNEALQFEMNDESILQQESVTVHFPHPLAFVVVIFMVQPKTLTLVMPF